MLDLFGKKSCLFVFFKEIYVDDKQGGGRRKWYSVVLRRIINYRGEIKEKTGEADTDL